MIDTPQREEAFCAQYFHLCHRLRRLRDMLIGLYLRGDMHVIVPEGFSDESVPQFCVVTFDSHAASRYERRVEIFLSKDRNRSYMLQPDFPVNIEVRFSDGTVKPFCVRFTSDNVGAESFCSEVCTYARQNFRHRFSSRIRTLS